MTILDWLAKQKKNSPPEREKLDIPGDLWVKCFKCQETIFNRELENNLKVCPKCGHHFRLSYKERLKFNFDENSFEEIDQSIKAKDFLGFKDVQKYSKRLTEAEKVTGLNDAVVCGFAKVEGYSVALGIMDFSFMGGSMGSVVGEKITRIIENSIEKKLPLIIISSSGGARMQEGIMSLMQMAKTSAALANLAAEHLPYISIITDPTTGGTSASFALLGDIIIAEPAALIGFAGPRVIEQTIRQKLPKGFQRSEYLLAHGVIDMVVERKEIKTVLKQIFDFWKN
jgi:acetyl-CoA carboxylase carboxyl transferase subunit beta